MNKNIDVQYDIQQIIQLIKESNHLKIQVLLKKGKDPQQTFYELIKELYIGNGFELKQEGLFMLVYHQMIDKEPFQVIQPVYNKKPMTETDIILKLNILEKRYPNSFYVIYSYGGFAPGCRHYDQFNLKMEEWEDIKLLMMRYANRESNPSINLLPHNKKTYENIKELWKREKRVAAVQATGTGKAYLIAQCLYDFKEQKCLVLAPSNTVLTQSRKRAPYSNRNTIYMTYAAAINLNDDMLDRITFRFIALDEFHRVGAEKWGKGVQRILEKNPDAYILGTSATPIRYLDGKRDMSEELFEHNKAVELSLTQAIVKRILPMPKYISALYSIDEEVEKLIKKINLSTNKNVEKKKIVDWAKKIKIDFNESMGATEVLKKHIDVDANKFIVFVQNIEHLYEMLKTVEKWFLSTKLKKKVYILQVHTKQSERQNVENLNTFTEGNDKEAFYLLFSIDMLNEGLHVPDIDGVVLLRPTASPIVFYQQIGRSIQAGGKASPLIIDLVNNFRSIGSSVFMTELEEEIENEKENRKNYDLYERETISVTIIDYVNDVINEFRTIEEHLEDSWELRFKEMVEFKNKYGHCRVERSFENKKLVIWVGEQRRKYNKGTIEFKRYEQLKKIGFIWSLYDQLWLGKYNELKRFHLEHGHSHVTESHDKELYTWVGGQRGDYKKGVLEIEKIQLLNELNFLWDIRTEIWKENYELLKDFYKNHGHTAVPGSDKYEKLYNWVRSQRGAFHKGLLEKDKIESLNLVNFIWDYPAYQWNQQYKNLQEYHKKYGHSNVPQRYKQKGLGAWVVRHRKYYKEGTLSKDRIGLLNGLDFIWNLEEDKWNKKYTELKHIYQEQGHINLKKTKKNQSILNWINSQRRDFRKGKLTQEKIDALNELNFVWNQNDKKEREWKLRYGELEAFYYENGHSFVSKSDVNQPLSNWVSLQRKKYKLGQLSEEEIELLSKVNFAWDVTEKMWYEQYNKLVAFYKLNGHSNAPLRINNRHHTLGSWVNKMRSLYKQNQLGMEKIELLEKVEFKWNSLLKNWETRYNELKLFLEKNGYEGVPLKTGENSLDNWIRKQRIKYKKGELESNKIALLNEIGIVWEPREKEWLEKYLRLVKYYVKHGHSNVSSADEDQDLYTWVSWQRKMYRLERLDTDKKEMLEKINFKWNTLESAWFYNYQELKKFHKKNGHTNVSLNGEEHQLGFWVSRQRQAYKDGKLDEGRIHLLESIKFSWVPMDEYWEQRYEELKCFYEKHGHTSPGGNDENISLGRWLIEQRGHFRKGTLNKERIKLLDELGVKWDVKDSKWVEKYEEMKSFYMKNGDCLVPNNEETRELYNWANRQRNAYVNGKIDKERYNLLQEINFIWDAKMHFWEKRYHELFTFYKKYGHAIVKRSDDIKLAYWVYDQRKMYKKGELEKEKIKLLNEIGFVWEVKKEGNSKK